MHVINDAYDAYWFLYNHPNCVEVDKDHPLIDPNNYESKGIGPEHFGAREGKPRDEEYQRAWRESRTTMHWEGQFIHNLTFDYVKVNPKTNRIEKDSTLNTTIRVWLETGPAFWEEYSHKYMANMHDTSLDVGGDTFDDALIKLAKRVKKKYGDYEDNN